MRDYREDLRKELQGLTPEELFAIYRQIVGYEAEPVSITTFLEDERFLGGTISIFNYIHESLCEIFPNPYYSPYSEIIVEGGIGSGKSTLGVLGSLYDLYKLLLIKTPQELYGLPPITRIVFFIYSATLDLASDVTMSDLNELISASPFFKEQTAIAKSNRTKTTFPKLIDIRSGSRFTHALGGAAFSVILDEANYQAKVKDQAYDNYLALHRRQQSRFSGANGRVPGHLWLISQCGTDFSFIEQHKRKQKNSKITKIYSYPMWVALKARGLKDYSGDSFSVFLGDNSKDPVILSPKEALAVPDEQKVVVPIEHRTEFEFDIINSIREIAGISVGRGRHKLLSSKEKLTAIMSLKNFFDKEEIELDFMDDEDSIENYFDLNRYMTGRILSNRPRVVHIDTGLTGDRLGISCGYLAGYTSISRFNDDTMKVEDFQEALVHVEWSLAIKAKPGQEIPLYKVRRFLIQTIQHKCKVHLSIVTTDGFQSADMRQMLSKAGVHTDLLSVDRSPDSYVAMRNAINEERLLLPKHHLLEKELWHLQVVEDGKNKVKVDHPKEFSDGTLASKDVSDTVAGVYINAANQKVSTAEMISTIASSTARKDPMELYRRIQKGKL